MKVSITEGETTITVEHADITEDTFGGERQLVAGAVEAFRDALNGLYPTVMRNNEVVFRNRPQDVLPDVSWTSTSLYDHYGQGSVINSAAANPYTSMAPNPTTQQPGVNYDSVGTLTGGTDSALT